MSQGAPQLRVDTRGPFLAVALVIAFILYTAQCPPAKDGSFLPWTLNPTGELNDIMAYVGLYAVTIPAKEFLNVILNFLGNSVIGYTRMDETHMGDGKVKKLEVLEFHDLCYLAANTLVEFLGMNHIAAFLLSGSVQYSGSLFNVFNGPLAFLAAFVINDFVYYPFHAVAHRRIFYPYCHKQHHRQFVPFRGYADAANQHPLEQTYGFSIWIFSLWITSKLLGLHAATAWLGTFLWALLNIMNHLPFDTRLHLPILYPALPRDHNTHHRFPNTNYSTLSSFMDRAFGSYRQYQAFGQKQTPPAWTSRSEAIPSGKSFFSLCFLLFVSLLAVETVQQRNLPAYNEMAVFMTSAVLLIILGLLCSACDGEGSDKKDDNTEKDQIQKVQQSSLGTDGKIQAETEGSVREMRKRLDSPR
mmetsp:Transcript_5966/g.10730  ORF Transcript_5966/g.10730 Transcript_5966/m.10730 type:complete len:415 (+) Transcript_5966:87-1331(+)